MKVVLIFDSGLSGEGGKSNPNCPLGAAHGGIGTAQIMEPAFKKINAEVQATLFCGVGYYREHTEEVVAKMTAMVKRLNPDFVVCGPGFNFPDYSEMCAVCCESILENTEIHTCAMMSQENVEVISKYAKKLPILKMPKKGGVGLGDSFEHLAEYMDASVNHPEMIAALSEKYCY